MKSPLSSAEQLIKFMDTVAEAISQNEEGLYNTDGDAAVMLTDSIVHLCKQIKIFGPQLERSDEGRFSLDRACVVFRNAIVRGSLNNAALKSILDVLESRSSWNMPETVENFSSRVPVVFFFPHLPLNQKHIRNSLISSREKI